jgi:hypothetical protein
VSTDHPEPAAELVAMLEEQQEFLHRTGTGAADSHPPQVRLERRAMFVRHADRLMQLLLAEGTWPSAARVGERAARAAWLVAQHADTQLDVQRLALRLLRSAAAGGEASPKDLAMLDDRVAVNEGRQQTYGTQIADVIDGQPVPWPVADPQQLDELRAEAGIEPFAVNAARYT